MTTQTAVQEIEQAISSPPAITRQYKLTRAVRVTCAVCAASLIILGALVLTGWLFGYAPLMEVLPGAIRMKANTAIGFVLAGVALILLLHPSPAARRWSSLCAALLLCGGAATLVEYVFGIDLHIDRLLFNDPSQRTYPGRMAHISAVNFCLGGISLLLQRSIRRHSRTLAQWLALLVLGMAFAAMVGYTYGVPILYGSVNYTSMALHTGLGFLVLGAGLLLLHPEAELIDAITSEERGGWMARRALPCVVAAPAVLGFLYLRPGLNFGSARFSMALFAVTVTAAGSALVLFIARSLNRDERARSELIQVREQSAEAVRRSERELQLVTDHLPTLVSYISNDGRFQRVNRTYELWMGIPAEEIVGRGLREILGEKYWAQTAGARAAVLRGEKVTFEVLYPTAYGDRLAEVTYAPDIDETGYVRGIACMVLDIEERREAVAARLESERLEEANLKLQELVVTDALTGLKNRRALEERLRVEFALSERHGRDLAVLMIDIDNFKLHNDTWGHSAGDDVLRCMGEILRATVRIPDVAVRYGGEEFAILLPESSLSRAAVVAGRIRRKIAGHPWPNGAITLSIGISVRVEGMINPSHLMAAADAAMYLAKRTGRDKVCFHGLTQ